MPRLNKMNIPAKSRSSTRAVWEKSHSYRIFLKWAYSGKEPSGNFSVAQRKSKKLFLLLKRRGEKDESATSPEREFRRPFYHIKEHKEDVLGEKKHLLPPFRARTCHRSSKATLPPFTTPISDDEPKRKAATICLQAGLDRRFRKTSSNSCFTHA